MSVARGGQYFSFYGPENKHEYSFSPQLNCIRGRINHLELRVGAVYNPIVSDNAMAGTIRMGYRYQRPNLL